MMVITVMGLADENDALGSELSDKTVQRETRVQVDRVQGRPILRNRLNNTGSTCEPENERKFRMPKPHHLPTRCSTSLLFSLQMYSWTSSLGARSETRLMVQ